METASDFDMFNPFMNLDQNNDFNDTSNSIASVDAWDEVLIEVTTEFSKLG